MAAELGARIAGGARRVYRSGRYRSRQVARRQVHRIGGVHRRVTSSGEVALTFDDGPDPRFTESLLGVLAELDVRATFFCIGSRAEAHPELMRAIVDGGHSVGSHSLSHPDTWTVGTRALVRELRAGHAAVESAIGRPTTLFRPPKGYLDARVATAIRVAGLRSWLWTVDPSDWQEGSSADDIVAACADVEGTDVVLLHDGIADGGVGVQLDRSATLAALPRIVGDVRARGLALTALSM
jgi:peptidoglycan/xylan/chitin deacetylase (PgdA/CDA1 family)